jgi:hypothetical protein
MSDKAFPYNAANNFGADLSFLSPEYYKLGSLDPSKYGSSGTFNFGGAIEPFKAQTFMENNGYVPQNLGALNNLPDKKSIFYKIGNSDFGKSLGMDQWTFGGFGDAAKTLFAGLDTYGRFKQLGLERDKVDLQRQALNADILGQDNATLSANQAHEQRLSDIAAVNQGIINDGGTPQAYTGTSAGNAFQYSDANRNQFAPLGAGVQPTVGQNPAFRNLV